jgi:thiamine-phosphate pyrophosphorylase
VSDRQFFDEAQRVARLCGDTGAPLFINGRLDVALALDAHLHCTSRSLTPRQVRPLLPATALVSTVVHGEADDAAAADLALVSPVFAPGSKPDDTRPLLGVEGFARLAQRLPCPAFALGGLTTTNAGTVKAPGVAVISAVLRAASPAEAARRLLDVFPASPAQRLTTSR